MGGGTMGGSLQAANIMTERARAMLRNMTNGKARELLTAAVEDPQLFRDLLLEPAAIVARPEVRNRLAPYLAGAAAQEQANQ